MRRLWDLRPPEFVALAPADRTRVWNHCYWRALRNPRLLVPLILFGVSMPLSMIVCDTIIRRFDLEWRLAAKYGLVIVLQALLIVSFAKYAVYVLRDELRACAIGCCFNCWYDLTGNESGVCPECGTARVTAERRPPPGDSPAPVSAGRVE